MENNRNPTSLKELFQGMAPEQIGMIEGVVTKGSPLTIQVINNPKMVLTGSLLVCPTHLSDYSTKVDIRLDTGSIDSQTETSGSHSHSGGNHSHSGGTHNHKLQTYNIYGASILVYNALKVGEKVWLLRFSNGKQYYILDRVVM